MTARILHQTPVCVLWHWKMCPSEAIDRARQGFQEVNTFVNISYAEDYAELELATWTVLKAHGLIPVLVRENLTDDDRLCKIRHAMWACGRAVSDYTNRRLNVALEDMAIRQHGTPVITMAPSREDFTRGISDLLPVDPVTHQRDPKQLLSRLSAKIEGAWGISTVIDRKQIANLYETFLEIYRNDYGYAFISEFYRRADLMMESLVNELETQQEANGEVK
jgi:hypothetical protein